MARSRDKRIFAGGWLSDTDDSLMALIWQLCEGRDGEALPDRFEAEVIRGVDKIDLLTGASVDELRTALGTRFGSAPPPAPSESPE